MGWTQVAKTACPIARSLALVGDRWTMLILRELFLGSHRFEEIQAQTQMSSHLLSMRLKRLERDGIIKRQNYQFRPLRHEYRLTEKGLDLYPVVLALKAWGEKWGRFKRGDGPALRIFHKGCGRETGIQLRCPSCSEPFGPRDATVSIEGKFERERNMRRTAFEARRRKK